MKNGVIKIVLSQKCIIKNKSGEILLIKRSKNNKTMLHLWEFPGGKAENKENIYKALKREVHEETGINIKNISNICHSTSFNSKRKKYKGLQYLVNTHLADIDFKNTKMSTNNDVLITLSEEHDEYKWVNVKNALKINLRNEVKNAIECFIKLNVL